MRSLVCLREHRLHQLGDRMPVRLVDRLPVHLPQPVPDRPHPPLVRSPPRHWPHVNHRITIGGSCFGWSGQIGEKLPQGWGDLGRQIGLLVLVDLAYETVRGLADGQRAIAFAHGQQIIDFERATHTFFEPGFAGVLPAVRLGDRLRQPGLHEQPVRGRARLLLLALHVPQRLLLLRAQHVHGLDGPGADRLRALPDRPAAALPRVRLRRHDQRLLQRQPRLGAGQSLHQPLRGGAEHALRLRADGRPHRRQALPPLVHADALDDVAGPGDLGRDRHRQPLLDRRRPRRPGRRLLGPRSQPPARPRPAGGLGLANRCLRRPRRRAHPCRDGLFD